MDSFIFFSLIFITYTIEISIVPMSSDYNIYASGSHSIDSSIDITINIVGTIGTDSFNLRIESGDSTSSIHVFEGNKFGIPLQHEILEYYYYGDYDIIIQ